MEVMESIAGDPDSADRQSEHDEHDHHSEHSDHNAADQEEGSKFLCCIALFVNTTNRNKQCSTEKPCDISVICLLKSLCELVCRWCRE